MLLRLLLKIISVIISLSIFCSGYTITNKTKNYTRINPQKIELSKYVPIDNKFNLYTKTNSINISKIISNNKEGEYSKKIVELINGLFALIGIDFNKEFKNYSYEEINFSIINNKDNKLDWLLICKNNNLPNKLISQEDKFIQTNYKNNTIYNRRKKYNEISFNYFTITEDSYLILSNNKESLYNSLASLNNKSLSLDRKKEFRKIPNGFHQYDGFIKYMDDFNKNNIYTFFKINKEAININTIFFNRKIDNYESDYFDISKNTNNDTLISSENKSNKLIISIRYPNVISKTNPLERLHNEIFTLYEKDIIQQIPRLIDKKYIISTKNNHSCIIIDNDEYESIIKEYLVEKGFNKENLLFNETLYTIWSKPEINQEDINQSIPAINPNYIIILQDKNQAFISTSLNALDQSFKDESIKEIIKDQRIIEYSNVFLDNSQIKDKLIKNKQYKLISAFISNILKIDFKNTHGISKEVIGENHESFLIKSDIILSLNTDEISIKQ
tara:strand:- start:5917 stop:7419 length:1503 start_codon:yes stop_codon:yes gene_type:complete